MALADLLSRLEGVQERGAGKWVAQCPAHADKSPSLSILQKPDGRVLLHCFADCDAGEVLYAVRLTFADLLPDHAIAHHVPAQPRAGMHTHAAVDLLKLMASEATLIAIAGENIATGRELTMADLDRVAEAVVLLRAAADSV